jgi:hypothetical protein
MEKNCSVPDSELISFFLLSLYLSLLLLPINRNTETDRRNKNKLNGNIQQSINNYFFLGVLASKTGLFKLFMDFNCCQICFVLCKHERNKKTDMLMRPPKKERNFNLCP